MIRKWLILDCPFLCHRAKHTTGALEFDGKATGAIYGFLRYLPVLTDLLHSNRFVFCWDSKSSKRKKMFNGYKSNRIKDDLTEEEIAFELAFKSQMKRLRLRYLSTIGFKNIFVQPGYEADDIIASICNSLPLKDTATIVSSDFDLYQLIRPNVIFYNPTRDGIMSLQRFKKKYGISPREWYMVKALAGCTTDTVPGIPGVGEKTAIKYLKGELNKKYQSYKRILSKEAVKIYHRNVGLVQLPLVGTHLFNLQEDKLSKKGWCEVTTLLGMDSIKGSYPFGRLRKRNDKKRKPI